MKQKFKFLICYRFNKGWILLMTMFVLNALGNTNKAADWKPAPGPLMTKWAETIDPKTVHQEYPRPQMVHGRPGYRRRQADGDQRLQPRRPRKRPAVRRRQLRRRRHSSLERKVQYMGFYQRNFNNYDMATL